MYGQREAARISVFILNRLQSNFFFKAEKKTREEEKGGLRVPAAANLTFSYSGIFKTDGTPTTKSDVK